MCEHRLSILEMYSMGKPSSKAAGAQCRGGGGGGGGEGGGRGLGVQDPGTLAKGAFL